MNPLVCLVVIIGTVSAQSWGGQGNHDGGYQSQGWNGGPRQPVVPAPLAHDGRVIDTPEINQAKAAHFAAHEQAAKAAPRGHYNDYANNRQPQTFNQEYRAPQEYNRGSDNNNKANQDYNRDYDNYDDGNSGNKEEQPRWRGPLAKIEFTQDGKFIKDTPEVAHAKSAHFAAVSHAKKNAINFAGEGGQRYEQGEQKNGGADDGQYRGEGEHHGQYNQANSFQGGNKANSFQGENNQYDDGQYRGESNNQQHNNARNYQGQGGNHNGRQQGGYY